MLETIRDQLMDWFTKRRNERSKMQEGTLEFVPKVLTLRLNHAICRLLRLSVK